MSDEFGANLNRWSQRKLAARRGAADDEVRRDDKPSVRERQVPAAGGSGPEQAVVADAAEGEEAPALPPIDELTAESDYTVFLGKNVPEAIKRAALRKLWLSDPVLANLDHLNDYDEDYSFVDSVISAVQSGYKVGKGYVDEAEETVAKLEPKNAGEAEAKDGAESPADPTARESESASESVADKRATADDAPDTPRQLAAAAPEAGEFPKDSGKT